MARRRTRRRGRSRVVVACPFRFTNAAVIMAWLNAKGHGGAFSDALAKYFKQQSGMSTGTLDDLIGGALNAGGYTVGTLQDRIAACVVSQTGIPYYPDAERAFFNNTSLDFSAAVEGGAGNNQLQFGGDNLQFNGDNLIFNP